MAGKSTNSFGAKNFAPGPPATRYNVSGKNREFYTYENAPGIGAYATGGTIIDGGDGYIYHIFIGTGTFVVNSPSAVIDSVDYLIVAGGGTAASSFGCGGGGGGGFLFGNTSVTQTPYPIVVGAAGADAPGAPGTPRNGSLSSAFSISADGGGGGAGPPVGSGGNGGSGGGGQGNSGGAGVGNSPGIGANTILRQGYPGGSGGSGASGSGGGGGGAGGFGGNGNPPPGAVGGTRGLGRIDPRFPSSIVGKAISDTGWSPLVSSGGYSSGGVGSPSTPRSSPQNSGYGGDAGQFGGSGIVCIRYKKNALYTRATGGTVEPSTNPEHIGVVRHIFTGPGTFEVTDPTLQYIDYLAVGGGGGGGGSPAPPNPGFNPGGGGGAGGFVSSIHTSTTTPISTPEAYPWNPGYGVQVAEQYPVGIGSYPISIGAGGASGTAGSNTTVGAPGASQIIAAGGGAGAFAGGNVGGAGGSGGGGATPGTPSFAGGTATPTPLIQGNAGGSAGPNTPGGAGGGGGGAGASGGGPPSLNGGIGWYSVLSPSSYGTTGPLTPNPLYRYFAGGGAGARFSAPQFRSGGSGGGGDTNVAGTVNTGGGGGGALSQASGGAGGSGIVIIQYPE